MNSVQYQLIREMSQKPFIRTTVITLHTNPEVQIWRILSMSISND